MESTIKKIFTKKADEIVHGDFVKYSKGVFGDKYMIEAKKVKDKWNIKTSNEFANFFVRALLEENPGQIDVKGVIVATFDVSKEAGFPIDGIKQFMGIKQAIVNSKIDSKKIISLMDKFPRAFYALSFSGENFELKIKAKAPKSAKPAAGGDKGPAVDFCSIKTSNKKIIDDLLFDCSQESPISIKHIINIDEITLPKGEKDPIKLREGSIRKGRIIRIVKIGEKEIKSEAGFEI